MEKKKTSNQAYSPEGNLWTADWKGEGEEGSSKEGAWGWGQGRGRAREQAHTVMGKGWNVNWGKRQPDALGSGYTERRGANWLKEEYGKEVWFLQQSGDRENGRKPAFLQRHRTWKEVCWFCSWGKAAAFVGAPSDRSLEEEECGPGEERRSVWFSGLWERNGKASSQSSLCGPQQVTVP